MTEKSAEDDFFTNLGRVLNLNGEKFEQLVQAFHELASEKNPREQIHKLEPANFDLSQSELIAAFESGLSFYEANFEFAEAAERTAAVVEKVAEVTDNLTESASLDDLKKRQLAIVEAFRPMERRFRIRGAFLHDERIYINSTTSPQLRPVFKCDSKSEIDTFVAIFNLQIEFYLGNEKQVTHMSMDLDDLADLKASLELAREQFDIMRDSLSSKTWEVTSSL